MSVKRIPGAACLTPTGEELALLFETAIAAHVMTAHEKPRRRGRAFLETLERLLVERTAIEPLWPARPAKDRAADTMVARRAADLYRQMRPNIVEKLSAG